MSMCPDMHEVLTLDDGTTGTVVALHGRPCRAFTLEVADGNGRLVELVQCDEMGKVLRRGRPTLLRDAQPAGCRTHGGENGGA